MSRSETQRLLAFVRQLPIGFAYAPIYVKDAAIQSGKISMGKTPSQRAYRVVMTPDAVAVQIAPKPDVFHAVGAFTESLDQSLLNPDLANYLAHHRNKWCYQLDGALVV